MLRRAIATCALLCALTVSGSALARAVPAPPDPGLEASIRAADAILDVEILDGGPFRALAQVRKILKGQAPKVVELTAYNSFNGNVAHLGFTTGSRYILFLSSTGMPGVYAALTPSAPRLSIDGDSVLLSLGNPPFRLQVRQAWMEEALALVLEHARTGKTPERALTFIKELSENNDVEPHYLAVSLAGWLEEERAVGIVADASKAQLIRLRLTAIETLERLATPEALGILRTLLKDEKAIVAREAAAALAGLKDLDSLISLLSWARREADQIAKLPDTDPRKIKSQTAITRILQMTFDYGPLVGIEKLAPDLLGMAKGENASTAADALSVLGALARPAQIRELVVLADDPVYALRKEAALALFRATLQPTGDMDAFRAWWEKERSTFSEDQRVEIMRKAAKLLQEEPAGGMQREYASVLLASPGEIALPAAAELVLSSATAPAFDTGDIGYWRTALAAPLLVERLGWELGMDRRAALENLNMLAGRQPRLRGVLAPLFRAALFDDYSGQRRLAYFSAGYLEQPQAVGVLIDALRPGATFEASEAARDLALLTARTLGHGPYEPTEEIEAAAERFEGWWREVSKAGPFKNPFPPAHGAPFTREYKPADLEKIVAQPEARPAGAAFAVLFATLPPGDELWARLRKSTDTRVRAHGLLGQIGEKGAALADAQALFAPTAKPDAALERAEAMLVLGAVPEGGATLVAWLEGAGAQADLGWKRLAIVALGLADGDARSKEYLLKQLQQVLAEEAAEVADTAPKISKPQPLRRALVFALAARADGTEGLRLALKSQYAPVREVAIRALTARRCLDAVPEVLLALGKADRLSVQETALCVIPILGPKDAPILRRMLDSVDTPPRIAAATIFAHGNVCTEKDERSVNALNVGLRDVSDLVRAQCAIALGKLHARAALSGLVSCLRDVDSEVRACAAEAIGRIGDREAGQAAASESVHFTRLDFRWFRALGLSGGRNETDWLLQLAKGDTWTDRRAGIGGLGYSPRPEAMELLLELFHDKESPYQSHAAEALENQGDRAIIALAADFESTDVAVRARALHVLARIATAASAERLFKALQDQDERIRVLADWALQKLSGKNVNYEPKGSPVQREEGAQRWRETYKP